MTWDGAGMMPSVTQCRVTARCQRTRSRMGRIRNQGMRRSPTPCPAALLVLPEIDGTAPGGAAQELVRVVLPDLAGHVPSYHAVVGKELGDAPDRLERQGYVEARVADGLGGHGFGQARLLRVDLGEALRVGLRDLHHVHVGRDQPLCRRALLLHEPAVHGEHGDETAHRLGVVVGDRRILRPTLHDALGAEGVPDYGQIDLLALQRLEIVAATSHDVDDAQLAVVEPVLLHRRRELEPGDRSCPHPDRLAADARPLLDVVTLPNEQAVVAGADASHADHGLGALTEAEGDVLWSEGGDVEIAGGECRALVREALEQYLLDLHVVLRGLGG